MHIDIAGRVVAAFQLGFEQGQHGFLLCASGDDIDDVGDLRRNHIQRLTVDVVDDRPLDVISSEVTNIVYVIARRSQQKAVLALLEAELERSNYPASDVDVHAFGADEIEVEATLATTSVDGDELDALVARISTSTLVVQAFWSPSTTE